ncbi:recombinase family protein [Micromonospora orduensis]|uniref:recombinase family protein n=1 Tax=Micromonospora orduensis TaxID=1420891 RepID=UPI00142EDFC5|nr:recombinase family protein [Micromonospora orduensis]
MSLDAALVDRIVREHRAGLTFTAISARLHREGVASPNGRPWHTKTVRRIYNAATRGGLA